ncbi:hypothetical protein T484DRAFT_1838200, partial [Baffinella frigidus]
ALNKAQHPDRPGSRDLLEATAEALNKAQHPDRPGSRDLLEATAEGEGDGEYVYDYYFMEDGEGPGMSRVGGRVATVDMEELWDDPLGTRKAVDIDLEELWDDNVILVGDEDQWMPHDGSDEDSNDEDNAGNDYPDEEDSNAEDHAGNDYPDEEDSNDEDNAGNDYPDEEGSSDSSDFVCEDEDFDHHSPDPHCAGRESDEDEDEEGAAYAFQASYAKQMRASYAKQMRVYSNNEVDDLSDEDDDEGRNFTNEFSAPMRPMELGRRMELARMADGVGADGGV